MQIDIHWKSQGIWQLLNSIGQGKYEKIAPGRTYNGGDACIDQWRIC